MLNSLKHLGRWICSNGLCFWTSNRSHATPTNPRDRQSLGQAGERLAAQFLSSLGYRIVQHGYRQRLGEIDLIALDGQCLVFVEVKTWRESIDLDPSAAVTPDKQDKITRAALRYLKQRRLLDARCRFDVVSIVWQGTDQPSIRHFKSAFEASGEGQLFR